MLPKESIQAKEKEVPAILDEEQQERTVTRRSFLQALGLASIGVAAGIVGISGRTPEQPPTPAPPELAPAPERALERFRITSSESTFNRLREANVFPKEHKWEITANAEAFYDIGRAFVQNPETAELMRQEEINILCPAAGNLLSPLEIAFQIAESTSSVQRVRFTFTEIDQEKYDTIDQYIGMLVNACENTFDFSVSTEAHPELAGSRPAREGGIAVTLEPAGPTEDHPVKKMMQFAYRTTDNRTVTITIDFELQMSGSDYYREESSEQADIFVFHDLDIDTCMGFISSFDEEPYLLLKHAARGSLANKKHYLVMKQEMPETSRMRGNQPIAYAALGQITATLQDHHYGCGENHWDTEAHDNPTRPLNSATAIIDLDTALFDALRIHGGEPALIGYSHLLRSNSQDSAGNEQIFSPLDHLISALQDISDHRIKERIRFLAISCLMQILDNGDWKRNSGEMGEGPHRYLDRCDRTIRRLLQGFRRA